MAKVKITLIKSLAGKDPSNVKTVRALGLRKIGSFRVYEKTPAIAGAIRKISYMIKTEDQ